MSKKNISTRSKDDKSGYMTAFRNFEDRIEDLFHHLWHSPFHKKDDSDFFGSNLFDQAVNKFTKNGSYR